VRPLATSKKRFREFRSAVREGWQAIERRFYADEPDNEKPRDLPREQRRRLRRQNLRDYRRWLGPYRWSLAGLVLLAACTAALDLVQPAAFGLVIDRILLNDNLSPAEKRYWLTLVCSGVLLLLLLARAVETIRQWWMVVLNSKIVHRLRQTLMEHCLRLPLNEITDLKAGGIVSRLSGDVDQTTGLMQMAVMSPIAAAIRIVFVVTVLLIWNWQLALVACAMLPPLVVISLAWVSRVRPIYRSMAKDRNANDGRVTETFGGLRVVRAFRRESREGRDYAVAHHTIIRKRLMAHARELCIDVVWEMLIPLTALAVLWAGGYMVIRDIVRDAANPVTVGQLVTFAAYVSMLMFPVFRIVFDLSRTQQALAAMDRVFDLFHKPVDKPDHANAVDAPPVVEHLRFEHVSFAYRPDVPVIHEFDLQIPGGSITALVGPSGAGKTTITDLLARFHDPTGGAIRLNGIDLRDLRLESYRRLLAVVQQEVFLFDGTVHDNIAYGRRDADEEAVIDAARRANADRFIRELPEGYDTLIGERGVKLSGGQRQRLSIARAVLADPQILILDEATSNLDTESEQLIQAALNELYANRTVLVIAHRLSTVTHADQIVVMDQGRIVEIGNHEQLMARGRMYYDMIERQRQFAATDAFE
jgi:ATP-binding cassette, subfamily B, bacterial